MYLVVRVYHMGCDCLDVASAAKLCACDISVAHQYHVRSADTDDTVNYVSATVHPSQHHVANLRLRRLLKDDALPSADNKRQHAPSVYWQRHAHSLTYQTYSLA